MSRLTTHRAHRAHRARAARGAAVLVVLLAGTLSLPLGPAAAHDELISTEPAPDAVLTVAPEVVALDFTADLLNISPTIVLTGPSGAVALDEPVVDGTWVGAGVPADLPSGAYTVAWRVVSADGHPIQGAFAFEVDAPAGEPDAVPDPQPDASPSPEPTSAPATAASDDAADGVPGSTAPAIGVVALVVIGAGVSVLVRRRR